MAAHGDSKMKPVAASSVSAAAASRPWRETASKRSSSSSAAAAASETEDDSRRKIVRSEGMTSVGTSAETAEAKVFRLQGLRQAIIRQSLLMRGGQCTLATGDGKRCDRATKYVQAKGIEGKERTIDCFAYCTDNCKQWARHIFLASPTGIIISLDGIDVGRFPVPSDAEVVMGTYDFERSPQGWEHGEEDLPAEEAADRFCEQFQQRHGWTVAPRISVPLDSFVAFRAAKLLPSANPTMDEWLKLVESKRLAFRFEGTLHPKDGIWIGPLNRWKMSRNWLVDGHLTFSTGYPALRFTTAPVQ
jgi:hypothetical protein